MKAILEFNMDDYDDIIKFKRYTKADDMAFALFNILYNTKKDIEYKIDADDSITPYDVLDMVYKKIYEHLDENNVNIDEIIV
jgi:DNA-directed RNA polymerase subunit L